MAQSGYTPIQLYYSTTAATAPLAANLANGELAINITDGKLFYKDNAAAVQVIGWKTVPTSAGGTGLTSYTAGDTLYYASGTILSKLAIGATNTVLTSSGSAPQWSTNLNIGSLTATSISDSGNLTFTGTGNRITGDFSNATLTNRVYAQNSTVNAGTSFGVIPNGTGTNSAYNVFANSDPTNTSFAQLRVGTDTSDVRLSSSITGTGTYQPMTFYTNGSEQMRITTAGNINVVTGNVVISTSGKGIDFSATPGTGTSELFADYEEGTWTVTVTPATGSLTAYNQAGQYTKVGRMVTLNFYFQITTLGTAGGVAKITGLPFSAATATIAAGAASENAVTGVGGVVHVQTTTELFVKTAAGGTPFTLNAYWICSISYFA